MAKDGTYSTDAELIEWVRDWKPGKGMNDVPGVPLSRFSITGGAMDDVRRLIAAGSLELVDVTKQSKVNPDKTMTYSYIRAVD